MLNLWTQRKRAHFLEMLKYLRYVLNDHFVIALMFLVGGLGFGYSNFLKTFHAGTWWAGPVAIFYLTIILQFCSLATLLKRADPVFLLPREHDMHGYLKKSRIHSWTFSSVVEVVGVVILSPFMAIAFQLSVIQIGSFIITLIILTFGSLSLELNQLYQNRVFGWQQSLLTNWIFPLIWFTGGIYLSFWFALVGAIIQSFLEIRREQQQWQTLSLAWKLAVNLEDQRMLKIYRFFNLFTDVPNVHGTVHRRKYLDRILGMIDRRSQNPYVYLFSRALMRSTVYSGLYFRLTILGVVLLMFISNIYLAIFLQLLFVYLIGFQLLPLFANYNENVFTHLYPISAVTKAAGFNQLVMILLEFTVSLLAIVGGLSNMSILQAVITWFTGSIEVWGLLKFYFPIRIKKMNS